MSTDTSGSRGVGGWSSILLSQLLGLIPFKDVINVSGYRMSTAEVESALIMQKGIAETAGVFQNIFPRRCSTFHPIVIGTADELTGQAI